MAEVEVERVEERLHSEVSCAFATGAGIESPTAGLDGDALFVLCPVGFVVTVVVAAAVAAAGALVDPKAKCFVKAEHLEYWEMIAHGKTIGLTSCRWKEIW
jgi:hypothetical protein